MCHRSTILFLNLTKQKTKRHTYECLVSVVQMRMKISYIGGNVVRHSHECLATVMRQSHDNRATAARYIFKIRPKFTNLSHNCHFYETAA